MLFRSVEIGDDGRAPKESIVKRASVILLALSVVFFLTTVLLLVLCLIQKNELNKEGPQKIPSESILEVKEAVNGQISGAAALKGRLNIDDSVYYKKLNFYNKKPTKTLTILSNFQTYQQTNDGSCGASATLMALNYMGEKNISENGLVAETLLYPNSTPDKLVNAFKKYDYKTLSSSQFESNHWENPEDFAKDLKKYLSEKTPVLVKLGGHWSVIIGYDDFGHPKDLQNHVLILADSWDSHDHRQDGYIVYAFDYFWNIWSNMAVKSEGLYQQFVIGYK